MVTLPDSTWCCGSAGIYNLTQPKQAQELLEKKIHHIRTTGAQTVYTANPGCHLQIESGLKDAGLSSIKVRHPISRLAEVVRSAKTGQP
jgi:glycolate oxidase iron-sulfur subunit